MLSKRNVTKYNKSLKIETHVPLREFKTNPRIFFYLKDVLICVYFIFTNFDTAHFLYHRFRDLFIEEKTSSGEPLQKRPWCYFILFVTFRGNRSVRTNVLMEIKLVT